MTPSRLARYFKSSRDNWKNKALEKQKKLRIFEQKIRDLEKSREQWKSKTKKAEKKIKELEKELEKYKKQEKESSESQKIEITKASSHHYTVQTIQISIQQVICGRNSYRSVEITMRLFSSENSPHFSSIRKWVLRVGLYELSRKKERRDDWIFIVDLTLEVGQEKALIVYGIPQSQYQKIRTQEKRALKHTDGEILTLEVTSKATGEFIQEKLEQLSKQVGIPQQILGDHGSNLKKGIQLYQKDYPSVIYTYDVTHAMSNFLKQQLSQDENYQEFIKACHQCRLKLQQTELAFLSPPSQRSQCRYFNVERLVNWGKQLLASPVETIMKLIPLQEFSVVSQRLKEKFAWLIKYEEPLKQWDSMIFLTRTLETQVKVEGFNRQSSEQFESQIKSLIIPPSLWDFKNKIIQYISLEIAQIKTAAPILATTDVLESLFGKYKQFSSRCPLKDLRQMLLTIPLSTMNLTSDVIQNALETIRGKDLDQWVNDVFGQSMLSKRKTLFSEARRDMKSA